MTSNTVLITGGRLVDPAQDIDCPSDLLIKDGAVEGVESTITPPEGARVMDATGMVVCPGFIDLHCHLREPGFEYKETIASGTKAAAQGGFTTICAMPNTDPVMDSRAVVDFVLKRAQAEGVVRVLPIGAVTIGSKGVVLSEMGELAEAGTIGFSDDGHPVADPNVMRQALTYSSALTLPIINHCEVPELSSGGAMNEGWVATRLGLKGIPSSAEEIMVARDISLAKLTKGRLHLAHVSTAGTVGMVRRAKAEGLNVTCEVTPHHLTLTEEMVLGGHADSSRFAPLTADAYYTNAKVAPPLRSSNDLNAIMEALLDDTVDFIATDHAPHSHMEKHCTFEEAANGISGLETALGLTMKLVHSGQLPLARLIEKLTSTPAQFLGMNLGTLKAGAPADVTIFDPGAEWIVDTSKFASKGHNSPLEGSTLKGKVVATIVAGEPIYLEGL